MCKKAICASVIKIHENRQAGRRKQLSVNEAQKYCTLRDSRRNVINGSSSVRAKKCARSENNRPEN